MGNRDVESAWDYHNGTKHPKGHLMNPLHRYDPMRNPLPFKIYRDLKPIPLSVDAPVSGVPALFAVATNVVPKALGQVPDVSMMTRILHYSAGITKTLRFAWGETPFRAAACTGALYHIELYLVCGDLPGLEAGVYHYDPGESALRRLRKGDFRRVLVDATGNELAVTNAPAVLIYTDVFWRNAVKYQAREYRHAFWDSGTIIANTLATAAACALPARVVTGFVDKSVNQLLGLDTRREVTLALVPIGYAPDAITSPPTEITPLDLKTLPVSDYEIDFPAIGQIQEASSLTTQEEVAAWREASPVIRAVPQPGARVPLEAFNAQEMPQDSIETVITRRGSTRRFSGEPITFPQLSTILEKATQDIPTDLLTQQSAPLNQIYLIVNSVEGLQPGAYALQRDLKTLELIREGDFRRQAGQLALGQALGADASANVYLMAELEPILKGLGHRGYRAAQLEASITAGKVYLAAYALGVGATGLTFYDDVVTEFFSPNAQGKSAMFLVALGIPARRGELIDGLG